jgi:hypothetical protein
MGTAWRNKGTNRQRNTPYDVREALQLLVGLVDTVNSV